MIELRPNESRARLAMAVLWIIFGIHILMIVSGVFEYSLYQRIINDEPIQVQEEELNDIRNGLFALLYLLAFIFSGFAFIQWFRRAYYNLSLKIDYLASTHGWAAGAWFVPIINLFRPYNMMREMHREMAEYLNKKSGENFSTNGALVGWWWATYLIINFATQIVTRMESNTYDYEVLSKLTIATLVLNLISLISAYLAIRVVKDYNKMELLFEEVD